MKRPKKIAGHDIGNNGEQHQKNRDPENPSVMHSPPTWNVRMTVVILVPMLSIVHRKQASTLLELTALEKKKVRSGLPVPSSPCQLIDLAMARRVFDRAGGFMTAQQISISLSG